MSHFHVELEYVFIKFFIEVHIQCFFNKIERFFEFIAVHFFGFKEEGVGGKGVIAQFENFFAVITVDQIDIFIIFRGSFFFIGVFCNQLLLL